MFKDRETEHEKEHQQQHSSRRQCQKEDDDLGRMSFKKEEKEKCMQIYSFANIRIFIVTLVNP